jgi:hypothetical protein
MDVIFARGACPYNSIYSTDPNKRFIFNEVEKNLLKNWESV